MMGRNGKKAPIREKPAHEVTLSSFYLGQYPVTQELWEAVMGGNPSHFKGPHRPVETVSWDETQVFLEKLNHKLNLKDKQKYRLPTEAEWELAAGGGDGRFYPWGDELAIDDEGTIPAVFAGTFDNLQPVNSLPEGASPFGVYHMAGNVWEWVADGYDAIYYDRSPSENPTGPDEVRVTDDYVLRGGGYDSAAEELRTTNRASERAPEFRLIPDVGFRCVTPVE